MRKAVCATATAVAFVGMSLTPALADDSAQEQDTTITGFG